MKTTFPSYMDAMDSIVAMLYNGGEYLLTSISDIRKEYEGHIRINDLNWILRRLDKEGFTEPMTVDGDPEECLVLSSFGMEILAEFKTYSAYIKDKKKKEDREVRSINFERNVRNWNIISAIIFALSAGFVTLWPKSNTSEQQTRPQDQKLILDRLDSLRHRIINIEAEKDLLKSSDTSKPK